MAPEGISPAPNEARRTSRGRFIGLAGLSEIWIILLICMIASHGVRWRGHLSHPRLHPPPCGTRSIGSLRRRGFASDQTTVLELNLTPMCKDRKGPYSTSHGQRT